MQTLALKMNMDTLNKLTAPATAKIRQLQKIVQDIKKNDGSLLNKLRRLKGRPVPKLPARDYRDADREDDEDSDPEYDNDDQYEDPHEDQDDSYEPPPAHRVFSATPSTSFPRGEYLDSCRNRPSRPPNQPLRPGKASKQLPPTPTHSAADEEDYVTPDDNNDDDNYVEPEDEPPTHNLQNPKSRVMSRTMRDRPMIPTPERSPSPDFYEVPDKEENSPAPPPSRLRPVPTTKSPSLPPKPIPRPNTRRCHLTVQEPTGEDEYEVCDPDDGCNDKPAEGRPPVLPKPLPRERSPKPPLRPRPESKPREFESRTLPVINPELPPTPPKGYSLDQKRPKIPLPQFTAHRQTDRGSVSAENGVTDQDMDADVYRKPWYAEACDRKTADDVLLRCSQDGGFMVRKSSGQDAQQPYTLVVFYKGRVYNIPIRYIPTTKQYALGREKRGEEYFSNVSHIIENHQRIPLVLIDSQSNTKDATKLCLPVKP
ncbi:B-cell linker protein isoform X2 [Sphaeramia orbicularis]|uniref:B-cell linker protein isoform X2 n=1 Tax=Sphaeramia orbicularis TaxID=375764 RepID=UPI001180081E|nr:B-cell linker protein isoform X2 [Sphaeramia orbicularis]